MPNWTYNRVSIRGTKADLDKFLSDGEKGGRNEDGYLCFNSWIPTPQTYIDYDTSNYPYAEKLEVGKLFLWYRKDGGKIATEQDIEDYKRESAYQQETYGVVGRINWARKNWGVKWDTDFNVEYQNDERIDFGFDTAWVSPIEFFEEISRRYPTLEIWLYSHFEDNYNEADYFYGGNHTDITDEIVREISKQGREAFAKDLNVKERKLFDEWIDEDCYDIAYLSEFIADDNDASEEIEKAFNEWLERNEYKVEE